MLENNEISYNSEILRKLIHLCSLSIPVFYSIFSKEITLKILVPLMFIFVISDILARFFKPVKKFIYLVFGAILRKHEKGEKFVLNGASWVLISAVGTILIFPKIIAISSFSILIISDISAALYGRKYGKHSFLDKSFEGSSAFVLTAIIAIFFIGYMSSAPWTFYFTGIIASFIGAIVEAASIRLQVDDNMSIPLSIGSVLWIGGLIAAYFNNGYLSVL